MSVPPPPSGRNHASVASPLALSWLSGSHSYRTSISLLPDATCVNSPYKTLQNLRCNDNCLNFNIYFSTASGDPLITVPPPSPLSYSTPVTSSSTADTCLSPQSKDRDILVSHPQSPSTVCQSTSLLIGKGRLINKLQR